MNVEITSEQRRSMHHCLRVCYDKATTENERQLWILLAKFNGVSPVNEGAPRPEDHWIGQGVALAYQAYAALCVELMTALYPDDFEEVPHTVPHTVAIEHCIESPVEGQS